MIDPEVIRKSNQARLEEHQSDLSGLKRQLRRAGHNVDAVLDELAAFDVALPSWALGTGGTRFGRFPGQGEPANIGEKLEDAAVVHQLTGSTPRISLHIPWDEPDDPAQLRHQAAEFGLSFDAVNSNTFQDQPGQQHSYKFGSVCHSDAQVRRQAIRHHEHVIRVGQELGSTAITVWLADGSNFPGQSSLRKSFDRTLASLHDVYAQLPADWQLLIEHKPFEPAFYATVVQDWGSSLMLAQTLGPRASCLVDLGHHLPNTNVEQVVARLITAGRLGGFHFNDSSYGDDDLTAGSIRPYQLFLIFNELVDARREFGTRFRPVCMIDQSHNLKDPIEALAMTVDNLQQAYANALLVDRPALEHYQTDNDVIMAEHQLQRAFQTDVRPLVREARRRKSGALHPLATFREAGYRQSAASTRRSASYLPPQSL
ncbi:MAG: TIM barrel protein [Bacteroidota bacterium]|nr:TIM barrel protein [Bacteroidota bacterium]